MHPIELVTREEWHETSGLTRHREAMLITRRRVLVSTDDRVTDYQNTEKVAVEPGDAIGVYRVAAAKPVNPLDDPQEA